METPLSLSHYLGVSLALFCIGIFGLFWNRKSLIAALMALELMLLAVNLNLTAFSAFLGDLVGQLYSLFVVTVAAAEAAIGLALLVVFYRNRSSLDIQDLSELKG